MNITLGQLSRAWAALKALENQKMPARVSYQIARLQRAIAPEVEFLEQERTRLARELGEGQDDGSWMVPKEQVPVFTKRYEELLEIEAEVHVNPVPIDALPPSVQLSPADMLALDFAFTEAA